MHILSANIPEFHNYFEPFLGGGALFFHIASKKSQFRAFLSDSNPQLVNVYRWVKDDVESVIKRLSVHQKKYNSAPLKYYYEMRKAWVAEPTTDQAARFIALNRTCYNGLYRVNKSGKFNVPMGRYSNPLICDADRLHAASTALNRVNAEISTYDFESALASATRGDFAYLDPPFDPLSRTSSFVSYTEQGFGTRDQYRLARAFTDLGSRGCSALLSNSNTKLVRALYPAKSAFIVRLRTLRAINSRGAARTDSPELLIANYHLLR